MIRFYSPYLKDEFALPEEESGHAIRVLRKKCGDEIEVVDGKGNLYRCVIVGENSKRTKVEILEEMSLPKVWTPSITLAVAPTKNMDRMEWLVEKSVEIGVDRIVPILCDRSERKVIKTERLQKIAISAMKQSLKGVMPEIDELVPLRLFLEEHHEGAKFFGYCDDAIGRIPFVDAYNPGSNAVIVIGPEGDFSPKEVRIAMEKDFKPVTFGKNRLRTETAALYGLQSVHILNDYSERITEH